MRQRDVWMILLCMVIVLLSFYSSRDHGARLSFIIPIDANQYANSHYPQINEILPNPIITDLDGDGKNEIVYVTTDHKIRILDPIIADDLNVKSLGRNSIKYEVSLASKVGLSSGRRIVAIQTGYTSPYQFRTNSQQIIVVVTEEWGVLAYNHQLKLLWERFVVDEIPKNHYHSEVAIEIVSNGLVIVGGRLEAIPNEIHRSHVTPAIGIDPQAMSHKIGTLDEGDTTNEDNDEKKKKDGDDHDHDNDEVHRDEAHFSYYAFNAFDGEKTWYHDEFSFLPKNPHADEEHHDEKRHSYKQHVYSLLDHIGEVGWKSYKQSMLSALPHRWSSKFDTRFHLAHFEKQSASKHNPKSAVTGGGAANTGAAVADDWNTELIGVHPSHFEGLIKGRGDGVNAPHSENDHITEPNVLIAHTKNGMEVIQLQNGRTLCKLILDSTNQQQNSDHYIVYGDLNNDGMVDQVHAIAGNLPGSSMFSRNRRQEICMAMGMSGLPPRDYLFNISICHQGGMDFDYFFWRSAPSSEATRGVQTVSPAIIASPSTLAGVNQLNDVVFLVNSGRITSVKHNGRLNWQRDTDARWQKSGQPHPHPSIQTFSLEVYGPKINLLAIADHLVVLDQNGEVLISEKIGIPASSLGKYGKSGNSNNEKSGATTSSNVDQQYQATDAAALNAMPMGPPVIGDLNNDGYNDILIPTIHGYYVYQLERGHSTMVLSLFVFIVAIVFLVMIYFGFGSASQSSVLSSTSSPTARIFGSKINPNAKSKTNNLFSKNISFNSIIGGSSSVGKRSTD